MEITKIFVAAQPDNLKTDVSELRLFFLDINNCYVSRGHYFTPILDDTISEGAARDAEIADCSLAFFLTEPGESAPFSKGVPPSGDGGLPDTHKAALDSYNKTGKPKVLVYTKSDGSVVSGQWPGDGTPVGATVPGARPSLSLYDTRPYAHT
ncbi:MAG: hypothetical protein FWG48_04885, partial [Oscillospiraceae bacterium]|nr:hypothetical protein [Oscillospiraceae bacterium]